MVKAPKYDWPEKMKCQLTTYPSDARTSARSLSRPSDGASTAAYTEHRAEHHEQRGEEPPRPAGPERQEVDPGRPVPLVDQQPGDEEARQHEERVEREHTTGGEVPGVHRDREPDGEAPPAVERGPVGAFCRWGGARAHLVAPGRFRRTRTSAFVDRSGVVHRNLRSRGCCLKHDAVGGGASVSDEAQRDRRSSSVVTLVTVAAALRQLTQTHRTHRLMLRARAPNRPGAPVRRADRSRATGPSARGA